MKIQIKITDENNESRKSDFTLSPAAVKDIKKSDGAKFLDNVLDVIMQDAKRMIDADYFNYDKCIWKTTANDKVIKHKPSTWEKLRGIQILDPDGWRKDGKSFNAPLTEEEWNERMVYSTVSNVHIAAKQINNVKKGKYENDLYTKTN